MTMSKLLIIPLTLLAISGIILTCTFKTYAQQVPTQQPSDPQTISPTQGNLVRSPRSPSNLRIARCHSCTPHLDRGRGIRPNQSYSLSPCPC
uniref:Uncharacterized protein n=1 Tax=Cyanothece sp. (strain PCC 7425 / ATCC 29141) TaxID=395961 RepID=B8HRX7_CYAP4